MLGSQSPYPPWKEGMTHACENITFPKLLLRAVTIAFQVLTVSISGKHVGVNNSDREINVGRLLSFLFIDAVREPTYYFQPRLICILHVFMSINCLMFFSIDECFCFLFQRFYCQFYVLSILYLLNLKNFIF